MGLLKTLCGGSSKIWAGVNNGAVKELSLSDHTHDQYVSSSQVETIVKEAMDVVKLVRTEKTSKLGTSEYTGVDADFIILHCYSSNYFPDGSNADNLVFNDYTIKCCKGYSAGAYGPTEAINGDNPYDTTVTFSDSTVTISHTVRNTYITVEFYKYQ